MGRGEPNHQGRRLRRFDRSRNPGAEAKENLKGGDAERLLAFALEPEAVALEAVWTHPAEDEKLLRVFA